MYNSVRGSKQVRPFEFVFVEERPTGGMKNPLQLSLTQLFRLIVTWIPYGIISPQDSSLVSLVKKKKDCTL